MKVRVEEHDIDRLCLIARSYGIRTVRRDARVLRRRIEAAHRAILEDDERQAVIARHRRLHADLMRGAA